MSDDGLSDEKKRLEQYLLQSKASNIIMVDPRYSRFKPEKIDTIRLRAAQIQAGKQPVSEKLIKEQLKKKKKARTTKQLRGEVGRAILEQKRFERGERRDKPEEEPRIIGEPRNTGISYDPDIERRRLDIQEQLNRDANLRALMDRRAAQNRLEQELAVRRGELAAGRAERRLERERLAALPAPAPIVIPAATQAAQAPVINIPPIADPTPEIQRLSALIRQDVNAFGAEQRAVNQDVLDQVRRQARRQEEIERRQVNIDEEQRQLRLAQDANLEEIQARLGMTEHSMGRARDAVIQEIRDAETRLRRAAGELDRPINYDDVILRAAGERIDTDRPRRIELEEVESPTPERQAPEPEREPQEPTGIEGIIEGGGPLVLPNIVVERPGNIGPDESLRLSPEEGQPRSYPRGTAGPVQKRRKGAQHPIRPKKAAELSPLSSEESSGGFTERSGQAYQGFSGFLSGETSSEELQFRLEPHDPIDVAGVLRLEEAEEQAEPGLRVEEAEEAVEQQGELPRPGLVSERVQAIETIEAASKRRSPRSVQEPVERVIEDAGIQAQPVRQPPQEVEARGQVEDLDEEEGILGQVEDKRAQRIRDSQTMYRESIAELSSQVRQGPRRARGERGGLGYRVRNNTNRPLKKVQPGDVVNIIGVEGGVAGRGRYRLDTQTQAGTRVELDQLSPLIESGAFLFEKGHRHELGGHFDREAYGPPSAPQAEEPGYLQQGAQAVGGAVAGLAGAGARGVAGLASGVAQGLYEQLPSASDVGAAVGRGVVSGVAGAGRLAAGAVEAALGGEQEEGGSGD